MLPTLIACLTGVSGVAVKCTVKARKVTIKGARGEVTRDFSHIACDLKKMKQNIKKRTGDFIRLRIWFGGKMQACAVNTIRSHIRNMIKGVTEVSFGSTAISFGTQKRVFVFGALFVCDFNY